MGHTQVEMTSADNKVCVRVGDDGVGLPEGLDFRHTDSLGLQLVVGLGAQLQGSVDCRGGPGTQFELIFPMTPARRDRASADL